MGLNFRIARHPLTKSGERVIVCVARHLFDAADRSKRRLQPDSTRRPYKGQNAARFLALHVQTPTCGRGPVVPYTSEDGAEILFGNLLSQMASLGIKSEVDWF